LTALHASDPVRFEGKIERWITDDVMKSLKAAEDGIEESTKETFFQRVSDQKFEGKAEWFHDEGRPNEILTRCSRYFDLLLMGQVSDPSDKKTHIRAEDIVTRSGKPLLIVPNGYECRQFTEYAVVAWDGSRAAARALTDAMQILETKTRIDVVTVARDANDDKKRDEHNVDIIRHLERHGIDARRIVLKADSEGKGSTLLNYCEETNPDILVTGAYGHSRLREDLFGGVTQYVMRHMNVPVFMSH
jgi:nucleotide-binding universal stress UspA family protein